MPASNPRYNVRFKKDELAALNEIMAQLVAFRKEALGSAGVLPTGGATEAKQDDQITELQGLNATSTSILNAILNTQDIEILMVRDVGNGDQIVQQIREYDQDTNTWNTSLQDVSGAAYVAVGPLEYLDPSAVLNLMLTELQNIFTTLNNINTSNTAISNNTATIVTNTNDNATETKQDTLISEIQDFHNSFRTNFPGLAEEATLSDLNSKFNTLGQKASAASAPFVLSTEQEAILSSIDTNTGNINTSLSDVATETTLSTLNSKLNTLGQKASVASAPVVLSTEQEAIIQGVSDFLSDIENHTDGLNNKINTLGQKASLASTPVVLSTEQETILDNIVTENQNIVQELQSIGTDLTGTLDVDIVSNTAGLATQATSASILSTLGDIQNLISAQSTKGSSATLVSVNDSTTSQVLRLGLVSRKTLKIFNDSTAILYVAEGPTASTTAFTYKVFPNQNVIIDDTTGVISGIWDADTATGAARITETV